MIQTLFLGIAGILSIVLFACIASYYKEIRILFRGKLNTRKANDAEVKQWQFEEEKETLIYTNYDHTSAYEELEYEESKPVYSSQNHPSVI